MNGITSLIATAPVSLTLVRNHGLVASPEWVNTWDESGDSIRAEVTFGPYSSAVQLDAVLVTINGEPAEEIRVVEGTGSFTLPAGIEFTYRIDIGGTFTPA